MAKPESKMICPRCGAEMNHHADKTLYVTDTEEAAPNEATGGGLVEEFHACPKCGSAASRHA